MEIRKEVRLLIVDDHGHYQHFFEDAVDTWHPQYRIECVFAKTAVEAFEKIASWNPTVVLLDAYFQDMSCFELITKCNPKELPIIVTSDTPIEGIRESVISKGAAEYFSLSEDPDEFDILLDSVAFLASDTLQQQHQ